MTYQELSRLCKGKRLPICGTNEDGENIIIEQGCGFFKLTTAQHNGWTRINYICRDGSSDELYKKGA